MGKVPAKSPIMHDRIFPAHNSNIPMPECKPSKIEGKLEKLICESCGAPLRELKCSYCGTLHRIANNKSNNQNSDLEFLSINDIREEYDKPAMPERSDLRYINEI